MKNPDNRKSGFNLVDLCVILLLVLLVATSAWQIINANRKAAAEEAAIAEEQAQEEAWEAQEEARLEQEALEEAAQREAEANAAREALIANYDTLPHLRITIECTNISRAVAESVAQSDDSQIIASYKEIAAYVVDTNIYDYKSCVTYSDGTTSVTTNPERCSMTIVVEGYYDAALMENQGYYKIGDYEVRIGRTYTVRTNSYEITGTIISMEVVNE